MTEMTSETYYIQTDINFIHTYTYICLCAYMYKIWKIWATLTKYDSRDLFITKCFVIEGYISFRKKYSHIKYFTLFNHVHKLVYKLYRRYDFIHD